MFAHLSAHCDSKAVPGVDGGQVKHQRNQLPFVEVRSCALEDRVGHMAFRDPGNGLGKRERRAFALGVKRRLLPCVEHVESLLGLAEGAGVFRMHFCWVEPFIDTFLTFVSEQMEISVRQKNRRVRS